MPRARSATRRIVPREVESRREAAQRAQKAEVRVRVKRKSRRQRAIEERGIRFEELPGEIKKVIEKIKEERSGKILRGIVLGGGTAAYTIFRGGKFKGKEIIAFGAFIGATIATEEILSQAKQTSMHRKLERLLEQSMDPRIELLSLQYPFFLVDRGGNLIFTTKERFLKVYGRMRGKTGKQRIAPDIEKYLQKEKKRREPIAPNIKRYMREQEKKRKEIAKKEEKEAEEKEKK